jgi:glutamate N-acetyltransferase/amino-acid N-acetyltransferase
MKKHTLPPRPVSTIPASVQSICAIDGVCAAGTREGKFGLSLIRAQGEAAAVFTKNVVIAEPVRLMKERIKSGRLSGIIVNSGCANVLTQEQGYKDAILMAECAADAMQIDTRETGVSSTGAIGFFLDMDLIIQQCSSLKGTLSNTPACEYAAANGILTTDLFQKHALVHGDGFSIGGICKGSGMIAPNMGTMLAFIYTDAEMTSDQLNSALKVAVEHSFNMVVVDGDTSTNDSVFLTATGEAGRVDTTDFQKALTSCCISLARQIAKDGEGATKMLTVRVCGAPSIELARNTARTIIGSPLVKTAVYGADPNWGRIVAAAGRSGVEFETNAISCRIGNGEEHAYVCKNGVINQDRGDAKKLMLGKNVVIELDLANGSEHATAWGCDLTEKYVDINGRYTT